MLITGANGFIGSTLCRRLASDNKVIAVDITVPTEGALNIAWEQADPPASPERVRWRAGLTDGDVAAAICERHSPDVVIHCAGIAHQKIGAVDSTAYMRGNSEATENLARAASKAIPFPMMTRTLYPF